MYIRVSKTMAQFLNKEMKSTGIKFEYREYNDKEYKTYINYDPAVDDLINDFNYKTWKYKAIAVIYPPEWYAMNDYISTSDLSRMFKRSDKTAAGFIQEIKDNYMI